MIAIIRFFASANSDDKTIIRCEANWRGIQCVSFGGTITSIPAYQQSSILNCWLVHVGGLISENTHGLSERPSLILNAIIVLLIKGPVDSRCYHYKVLLHSQYTFISKFYILYVTRLIPVK